MTWFVLARWPLPRDGTTARVALPRAGRAPERADISTGDIAPRCRSRTGQTLPDVALVRLTTARPGCRPGTPAGVRHRRPSPGLQGTTDQRSHRGIADTPDHRGVPRTTSEPRTRRRSCSPKVAIAVAAGGVRGRARFRCRDAEVRCHLDGSRVPARMDAIGRGRPGCDDGRRVDIERCHHGLAPTGGVDRPAVEGMELVPPERTGIAVDQLGNSSYVRWLPGTDPHSWLAHAYETIGARRFKACMTSNRSGAGLVVFDHVEDHVEIGRHACARCDVLRAHQPVGIDELHTAWPVASSDDE